MSWCRVLAIPGRVRYAGIPTGLIMVPATATLLSPFSLCFRHFLLINEVESVHERACRLLLRVVHIVLIG